MGVKGTGNVSRVGLQFVLGGTIRLATHVTHELLGVLRGFFGVFFRVGLGLAVRGCVRATGGPGVLGSVGVWTRRVIEDAGGTGPGAN